MDRKKKIITGIGGIIFIGILTIFIKYMFYPSASKPTEQNQISIDVPKVDENKIRRSSKLQNYEQDSYDKRKSNKIVRSIWDVDSSDPNDSELDTLSIISGEEDFEDKLNRLSKKDTNKGNVSEQSQSPNSGNEEPLSAELKELLAMQNQLISQNNSYESYVDPAEIESLLRDYGISISNTGNNAAFPSSNNATTTPVNGQGLQDSSKIEEFKEVEQKFGIGNYFQGAGSVNDENKIKDLIPAETVDEELLVNGSTIALRTKKDIQLTKPRIKIAKGSIIYGKVTIAEDRLMIDIKSYKEGLKLYVLDFIVYDFDGREGIHLGNRSWPKIPSKVTKDVYEYAYQRGTQAATFGGDTSIDLEQAKDIAILSAAKNIGNEVFDKRKVLMPKKYYLWFNINTN